MAGFSDCDANRYVLKKRTSTHLYQKCLKTLLEIVNQKGNTQLHTDVLEVVSSLTATLKVVLEIRFKFYNKFYFFRPFITLEVFFQSANKEKELRTVHVEKELSSHLIKQLLK